MRSRRSPAGTALVAASLILLSTTPAPAQATAGRQHTAKPAAGAMDWTPTLRPFDARREKVRRNLTGAQRSAVLNNCWPGYLCVAAGEGDGQHTVYELWYCSERSLTNFIDAGAVNNNQHGVVKALLKDRNGIPVREIPSDHVTYGVEWYPIYFIQPC
ncbi:hypothetical protein ACIBEJ_39900 [Nonomuraea sp. NPDC050790]|uniref:hypothetical protein n=1 Tax=Nonomuraea sp. NPDC050790 TaxID=3364371 RepID=UPI00379713DD